MEKLRSKTKQKFRELHVNGKAYFLSNDESKEMNTRIGLGMENVKMEYTQREIQSRALTAEYEIGMNNAF